MCTSVLVSKMRSHYCCCFLLNGIDAMYLLRNTHKGNFGCQPSHDARVWADLVALNGSIIMCG